MAAGNQQPIRSFPGGASVRPYNPPSNAAHVSHPSVPPSFFPSPTLFLFAFLAFGVEPGTRPATHSFFRDHLLFDRQADQLTRTSIASARTIQLTHKRDPIRIRPQTTTPRRSTYLRF